MPVRNYKLNVSTEVRFTGSPSWRTDFLSVSIYSLTGCIPKIGTMTITQRLMRQAHLFDVESWRRAISQIPRLLCNMDAFVASLMVDPDQTLYVSCAIYTHICSNQCVEIHKCVFLYSRTIRGRLSESSHRPSTAMYTRNIMHRRIRVHVCILPWANCKFDY